MTRYLEIISLFITITLLIGGCTQMNKPQKYGMVIGLKEEELVNYKEMHESPWPEVNAKLKEINIQNYSIYLTQFPDGNYYLFSYFEYVGDNIKEDMKRVDDEPKFLKWLKLTGPMQIPLSNRADGEWWKEMEMVYDLE